MRARRNVFALGVALLLLACGGGDDDVPEPPVVPSTGPPAGLSPAEWGARLFVSHGCIACHQVNGTRSIGPALDGIAGNERALEGGAFVLVDEAYLRHSILRPGDAIALGHAPSMPSYEGRLSDVELDSIVAYLEEL